MAFVLNRFPHAEIRLVIVVAQFAERIPATFRTAVGANRRSAVRALGYGRFAAWRSMSLSQWIRIRFGKRYSYSNNGIRPLESR